MCRPVWHQEVSLLCCLEECWELFALSAPASARLSFAVSGCAHSHMKPVGVFFPAFLSFFSFAPPASYFTLHAVKKAQWRWCYGRSQLRLSGVCEAFGWQWQSWRPTFVLLNAKQTLAWSGWPGIKTKVPIFRDIHVKYIVKKIARRRNKTEALWLHRHTQAGRNSAFIPPSAFLSSIILTAADKRYQKHMTTLSNDTFNRFKAAVTCGVALLSARGE